jgi:hypothetical protein
MCSRDMDKQQKQLYLKLCSFLSSGHDYMDCLYSKVFKLCNSDFRGLWRYVNGYWCKDSEVTISIEVFQMTLLFQIKKKNMLIIRWLSHRRLGFFSNHIASVCTHDFFHATNCEINWSTKVSYVCLLSVDTVFIRYIC